MKYTQFSISTTSNTVSLHNRTINGSAINSDPMKSPAEIGRNRRFGDFFELNIQ